MKSFKDILRSYPPMQILIQTQVGQQLYDPLSGSLILLLQKNIFEQL